MSSKDNILLISLNMGYPNSNSEIDNYNSTYIIRLITVRHSGFQM